MEISDSTTGSLLSPTTDVSQSGITVRYLPDAPRARRRVIAAAAFILIDYFELQKLGKFSTF